MSPRINPHPAGIVAYPPQGPERDPADIVYAGQQAMKTRAEFKAAAEVGDPYSYQRAAFHARTTPEGYVPTGWPRPGTVVPSFWRDFVLLAESEQRSAKTLEHPILR